MSLEQVGFEENDVDSSYCSDFVRRYEWLTFVKIDEKYEIKTKKNDNTEKRIPMKNTISQFIAGWTNQFPLIKKEKKIIN